MLLWLERLDGPLATPITIGLLLTSDGVYIPGPLDLTLTNCNVDATMWLSGLMKTAIVTLMCQSTSLSPHAKTVRIWEWPSSTRTHANASAPVNVTAETSWWAGSTILGADVCVQNLWNVQREGTSTGRSAAVIVNPSAARRDSSNRPSTVTAYLFSLGQIWDHHDSSLNYLSNSQYKNTRCFGRFSKSFSGMGNMMIIVIFSEILA